MEESLRDEGNKIPETTASLRRKRSSRSRLKNELSKSKSCRSMNSKSRKNSKNKMYSRDSVSNAKKNKLFSSAPVINATDTMKKPKRSKSEVEIRSSGDTTKARKIFGFDEVIDDSHPQFAPQPRHIRYFKLKKLFGQDIAIEFRDETADDSLLHSELMEEKKTLDKSRRVQKFFGYQFDLCDAIVNARARSTSDDTEIKEYDISVQPSHIDIIKLNKFFGIRPNVHKRDRSDLIDLYKRKRNNGFYSFTMRHDKSNSSFHDEDDCLDVNVDNGCTIDSVDENFSGRNQKSNLIRSESSDSIIEIYLSNKALNGKGYSSDNEDYYCLWDDEEREFKSRRKLKSFFGMSFDLKDGDYKLYAPQPCNVKTYKMKKIFGSDVIIDYNDDEEPKKASKKKKNFMKHLTEKKKSRKIKSFFGNDMSDRPKKSKKKKKKKKH